MIYLHFIRSENDVEWREYAKLLKMSTGTRIDGMPTDDVDIQRYALGRIIDSVKLHRETLQTATQCSHAAWLARNLLELAIWAEYCRSEMTRAQEFFFDGTRDAYEALEPLPWADDNANKRSAEGRQDLLQTSKQLGYNIEQSYTKVYVAANALNRIKFFKEVNKSLSKFAHPSAIAIINLGREPEKNLTASFKTVGDFLAKVALMFANLDGQIMDPYRHMPNL